MILNIGWADNLICQPLKQAAATAVAAKGAAIGTLICPGVGTTIGAAVGYIGTLYGWAKARNKIVDKGLDIEE